MIHSRLALAFRGPNLDLESSRGGLFGLAFLDESSPLQMEPEPRADKAKPYLVSQVRPCWLLVHRPPVSHCPAYPTVGSREWTLCVEVPPSITATGGRSSKCMPPTARRFSGLPAHNGITVRFPWQQLKQTNKKVHFVLMPQSSLCCHT